MDFPQLHGWSMTYREAAALQKELARRLEIASHLPERITAVAGVDVSYKKHGDQFFAAVVVLSFPDFHVIEEISARSRVTFPYIPGLLSFRELPVLLEAFRRLQTIPDVILVDGQGIAHPRGLGIASHLGLWLDLPTIGCAKSRLCGEYETPGARKGERTPLFLEGKQVGAVLTTRDGVKPLFISPGHKVDCPVATELALKCALRYRMPEPTRLAHRLSNDLRREDQLRS